MSRKAGRFSLGRRDRVVLAILVILAVLTAAVTLLDKRGLRLIRGEVYLFLPATMLAVAIGWGISAGFRRIRRRGVRIAVGALLAVATMLALAVGVSYISFVVTLTMPQQYNTVRTGDGHHSLVVMRQLDLDEDRTARRRAARLAADPAADPEDASADWGWRYTAYAPAAGIFYRPDSLIEGEVYLGHASPAQLMLDWEEDGAVGHFFVKDPESGDGGEMRARSAG